MMNEMPMEKRVAFALAVLDCIEQDITIYEVNSYIEDGKWVVAAETDPSRGEDVMINMDKHGINCKEISYNELDLVYVYGTV